MRRRTHRKNCSGRWAHVVPLLLLLLPSLLLLWPRLAFRSTRPDRERSLASACSSYTCLSLTINPSSPSVSLISPSLSALFLMPLQPNQHPTQTGTAATINQLLSSMYPLHPATIPRMQSKMEGKPREMPRVKES